MQAKKSLGQHFLTDTNIIGRIIDAVKETEPQCLLEVGPGGGAITEALMAIPGVDFKAVEIDDEKVDHLLRHFPALKNRIIHTDFLSMEKPFDESFVIVGNFPYNISTEILFKVLEWREHVPAIIGMFQKEVAQRVAAGPGSKEYGVTSALIQPFYDIQYLFDVAPGCFNPPPKVMSGVIRLTRTTRPFNVRSEKDYRLLVKTAFGQRRKKLRNPLKPFFTPETLADPIFDKRPEQLGVEDFASLTHRMK
jgi:16S rRNA (adenine1518-N6/adenine1519-N6)-dimethyltransferase